MDRIDSYIHEVFAKFRDVPEIQAQKEEMADHLRDRIRDAMAGGKSEKEAFDSVTGAVGESMSDLEQTLAEFLRPEFRHGERVKAKPKTKEIYINFYRYHRAMMMLFAQILFTLMIFIMCEFVFSEHLKINLIGLAMWVNWLMGIYIVYSIAAYMWNPRRVKRVSISLWRLLGKFVIGVLLVCLATLACLWGVAMRFEVVLNILLCFLLYYAVFFGIFTMLGWFRQKRYMLTPDTTQDTPLAKWGFLFSTIFFVALMTPMLITLGNLTLRQNPALYGAVGDVMLEEAPAETKVTVAHPEFEESMEAPEQNAEIAEE